jgi:tetratricopeptide (TPR) repeat protein
MKNGIVLLCAILLNNLAFACGNQYGFTLDGKRVHTRYFFLSNRMLNFDKIQLNKKLKALNLIVIEGNDDFKTWSNIALNLMKLGDADSSIQILRPLLNNYPNEYNLMANLGTAFELTGQLDSALYYISKGYEINPNSHLKSEWVHVAILKAKIEERKHKGWLKSNSVLDLDDLIKRVGDDSRGSNKVSQEMFLQIRTRAPFTPSPNKILANILETLGDFNMEVGTYENSILAYAYAMNFEPEESQHYKIKKKIKILNKKRINSDNIQELPNTFQMMLKRSQISIQLLVLGLVDFAERQDEFHLELLEKNDSIETLIDELDSLKLQSNSKIEISEKNQLSKVDNLKTKNKLINFIYLAFGLVFGGFGMFFIAKRIA